MCICLYIFVSNCIDQEAIMCLGVFVCLFCLSEFCNNSIIN